MTLHQIPPRQHVHLADLSPRGPIFNAWERRRHRQLHWFVELFAEFMGVFFYVYCGVGSNAAWQLGPYLGLPQQGSLLQVGFGFAIGIMLALVVCGSTSGHFNPAVTISLTLLRRFSPLKAARYVLAQILGAYIACLLIYVQWRPQILIMEASLASQGVLQSSLSTPGGPSGIFALYVGAGANLGSTFLSEFVCDFLIGLTIWSCMDPTNFGASPMTAPWIVSFSYAAMIWGFAPVGLATNTARDLGSRFMALTIWGTGAAGGNYAAIAALTNIVATFCAVLAYEFFLHDSSRTVTATHLDMISGLRAHEEHSEWVKNGAQPVAQASPQRTTSHFDEKVHNEKAEVAHMETA